MAAYVMSMTLTEITAHIRETTSSFLPLMGSLELSGVGSGSSNQASSLSVFMSCDWFFHDTVFLACFPVRFPFWTPVAIANVARPLSSSLTLF